MKVAQKVVLAFSLILIITISTISIIQFYSVKHSILKETESNIKESTHVLAIQIANWLNGRLDLINYVAETIDANFSKESIQQAFDRPILKSKFQLIFGGLDTDGKAITNDKSWSDDTWDARKRPWYPQAKNASSAVLTDPYADSSTGEILISAVAKLTDKGQFKGAFGGDINLKTVSQSVNILNFHGAGYAFLLSKDGVIISHPDAKLNGKNISELFTNELPSLSPKFQLININGKSKLVYFTPLTELKNMNWMIGVVLDENTLMSDAHDIGITALIGALVSTLISIVVIYFLMSLILSPLKRLFESLVNINRGEGDLTHRLPVDTKDEIGKVSEQFNEFISHLQILISDIKGVSYVISEKTDLTSKAAQRATKQLQTQLSELDHLATAMNEMSATAHDVALNAQKAASSANSANTSTQTGVKLVNKTSSSLKTLELALDDTVRTINQLAEYSNNIASILTVITGIAEQTNLLALNAAIEAARAGEQGRGFAVVADEVRALASKTQQSTEEIQTMIDQLQSGVKIAEEIVAKSKHEATTSADIALNADDALHSIEASINEINGMNVQIATAAEEQSATTEEINRNTTNIQNISQEVSEGAIQQSELCNDMVEQTRKQDQLLSRFKV